MCVCVCERERERERTRHLGPHLFNITHKLAYKLERVPKSRLTRITYSKFTCLSLSLSPSSPFSSPTPSEFFYSIGHLFILSGSTDDGEGGGRLQECGRARTTPARSGEAAGTSWTLEQWFFGSSSEEKRQPELSLPSSLSHTHIQKNEEGGKEKKTIFKTLSLSLSLSLWTPIGSPPVSFLMGEDHRDTGERKRRGTLGFFTNDYFSKLDDECNCRRPETFE